jgi:septum site-determining protein MinD
MTKFIAIASGKGGVGKTTTAINLACALSGFGKDTLVVDSNVGSAHVALYLGSPLLKPTLNDALRGTHHITEVAYLHPSGVKIIPADTSLYASENTPLHNLKDTLIGLIGTTDIVLVDVGSGFRNDVLHTIKAVDEMIVIATPDIGAVSDCIKIIRVAEDHGIEVLGAVINKATGKHELTEKNIATLLEKPILGVIPEDPSVKRSLLSKHPVIYAYPDSISSIAFKQLAAVMLGQKYIPFAPEGPSNMERLKASLKDSFGL